MRLRWTAKLGWTAPLPPTGAERTRDDLPGAFTECYWQTPMTPVPAGPVGVPHVPVITTLPTVPLQHGVPPPMQLRPLGRQQLPRSVPPDMAKFVQQAPSSDRQCPLLVP